MFKKINKIIGLNANGIDYITTDLSIPYYEYGSVLESNSSPGIETHHKNNPASIDKFMKLIKFEEYKIQRSLNEDYNNKI
jgi:hypothetical protein